MRVSIITPSYNQAAFLEQTMLSVLNQSIPDIEYIIIDGGSSDGSVEIIQKYESRLSYWHSRKDRGHWDAVNQGFRKAKGDILHFVNSDDLLLPEAVPMAVSSFQNHPDASVVYGKAKFIDAVGNELQDFPSWEFDIRDIFRTWLDPVPQPSAFLRKEVFEKFGSPDEAWPFCADFEYWIRISAECKFYYLQEYLSCMRLHHGTKTSRMESLQADELIKLCKEIMNTRRFIESGVDPRQALQGVYLCASQHFRNCGKKKKALGAYFLHCWNAFAPPFALYRFCKYVAGMIVRGS